MFDTLTQRLARITKTLRGTARLTEANTQDMLREVRIALLEADVALPVVRDFIGKVKEAALGQAVLDSLTPGQALVGVVQRELTALIGGDYEGRAAELQLAAVPPVVILMAGLQGVGKTTTVGKLARFLKEQHKKKVLTVSCDVYRPAAMDQLKTVSQQAEADCFEAQTGQNPQAIAKAALEHAQKRYYDVLIVDTAGRLGIDEAMMAEIRALHDILSPTETLFVVDAMLGQDAVNTAQAFNSTLPLTGIVLTKLDGDSRGGVALSVRHVTGKPIKFAGTSEKLDGLEAFHPGRIAERILGMGDIVAFVERAQRNVDEQAAQKLAQKVKKGGNFDLNDFRMQIAQMSKMSNLSSLIDTLPAHIRQAANATKLAQTEKQATRMQGMIDSMTPTERHKPELIKASRKRRIATGAGVQVQEVNRMLAQYEQMRTMVKKLKGSGMGKMMRGMGSMLGGGGLPGMR